jgi:hypothetical protein
MNNEKFENERNIYMKAHTRRSRKQEAIDNSEPITKCLHTDMLRKLAEAESKPEDEVVNIYCFTCFAKNRCSANCFKE